MLIIRDDNFTSNNGGSGRDSPCSSSLSSGRGSPSSFSYHDGFSSSLSSSASSSSFVSGPSPTKRRSPSPPFLVSDTAASFSDSASSVLPLPTTPPTRTWSRNAARLSMILLGVAFVAYLPHFENKSINGSFVKKQQRIDERLNHVYSSSSSSSSWEEETGDNDGRGVILDTKRDDHDDRRGSSAGNTIKERLYLRGVKEDDDDEEAQRTLSKNVAAAASTSTSSSSANYEKMTTTTTVQNNNKAGNNKKPIRKIALLGERNSGTRWIDAELKKCFPTISVEPELTRWKHWFQYDDHDVRHRDPTLVIVQFRNPYEWTEAMRHVPHHAPNHLRMLWDEFITTPWTLPNNQRPQRDLELMESLRNRTLDGQDPEQSQRRVCYNHFTYKELMSCVEGNRTDVEYQQMFDPQTGFNIFGRPIQDPHDFSAHKPIYELNPMTGEPFRDILEMRSAKIRNFLSIQQWDWIHEFMVVRYEKLLAEGTETLISRVEEVTGLERQCAPSQPQKRSRRDIHPELIRYITQHLDWEAEQLIGYEKWDEPTKEYETYYHKRYWMKKPREFWMKKYQPVLYEEYTKKKEVEEATTAQVAI